MFNDCRSYCFLDRGQALLSASLERKHYPNQDIYVVNSITGEIYA